MEVVSSIYCFQAFSIFSSKGSTVIGFFILLAVEVHFSVPRDGSSRGTLIHFVLLRYLQGIFLRSLMPAFSNCWTLEIAKEKMRTNLLMNNQGVMHKG